jgi:hypothetical protein
MASFCFIPLMSETKSHTHIKLQEKYEYNFVCFDFYIFKQETRRKRTANLT